MTVHSGRGWRLAPSLIAFEQEANRLAPRRSQASDGSIGDAAHRARVSDHNPDGGWVHGLDLTHDPRGGFDAHAHGRSIAARGSTRGHQADIAAQLAEVVMREEREWSDDLRESEQACRDQLDQMRGELERMRIDLASTRRELEDTRRELEQTRGEVHGLRQQMGVRK